MKSERTLVAKSYGVFRIDLKMTKARLTGNGNYRTILRINITRDPVRSPLESTVHYQRFRQDIYFALRNHEFFLFTVLPKNGRGK